MNRITDKQALARWNDYRKVVAKATTVDPFEDPRAKELRKERLKGDFAAFCQYYFPNFASAPFAHWHLKQVKAVQEHERGLFVWVMARDHAKSVVHGVFLPLWLMVRGELRTMLLASWSEGNAIDLLQPLQSHLEVNARLVNDWGPFRNITNWELGDFTTLTGCSFRALGSGQSPRGSRNDADRPDFILVDDLDEDEQSRNPKRVDDAYDWVMGALFPAMSIAGRGRFVMVGNIIAKNTVLAKVREKADHTMQVDILDKHGRPSWPERFSLQDCQYMITKLGHRLAQREYFNNPIEAGKVFKPDWMPWKKLPPLRQYRAVVAYLDPGFKKTSTADSKAWVMVGLHDGQYHVIKAYVGVASVNEMIGWGYALQEYVEEKGGAVRLMMEEVFLQDLLYQDFDAEAKQRGKPLPLRGDKRKKPEKDARIEAISGHFERGNVYFNEAEQNNPHMKLLREQLLNFQPGVKTHKDGPDALEGAIHALSQAANTNPSGIHVGARYKSKHRL